ncbi:MAG: hybrid sensor histidine kinase/response regulator [Acidobacteria bacterium]|nr:MAG: hybrid sensor histidine kinase/response regulator [Acidobacteriota bacterium]
MRTDEAINILMVDDSPPNLLALESILRAPDRNLIRASSGEEALRYLLNNDVAVILMDVFMPGMDGLETAELVRGRDKSRDIPIIFLTADSSGGSLLSRGYSLGAVDYIVKPIEPDILRSKVNVFVELYKKTQEIQHQAELLREKNLELENANLARLKMLIDLGQELSAEHDPAQVLQKFCRSGRRIVNAETAAAGVIDSNGETLNYYWAPSENGKPSKEIPTAVQQVLQRLISQRRPLRLTDSDATLSDPDSGSDDVRSFLGAPILSGSAVSGWFCLLNKINADDFSEADERLAATLAHQVAIAYENARLYTEVQNQAAELRIEVAERKQAEEERAHLLIREQAAREEAERANRAKDQFLATLSHELRTPLSAILGWSQLVRTGRLEDNQLARAVETIERNARSQSQLIDDLLDVSRIITGKLQIEFRQVDLARIIEAALDSVRPIFETKGIHFKVLGDMGSCPVRGDSNRLQQIFWNLFNNAVKFTPAGGEVNVKVKRKPSRVVVSITDTGIGIDPKFLPFIFERFRQADGSTTRAHGGLGLGLAIVRHLIDLHKGDVTVESGGQGLGSTFTVTLPLVVSSGTGDADASIVDSDGKSVSPDYARLLDGVRILVVDDERDSRELMTAILTGCGSQVKCSESAAEALATFKEWHPDVIVTDIGMPVEDGYSLLKKLRKLRSKRAKQIPAVALTAYATSEDRAHVLSAGFQMHLAKPIEPKSLVKSIAVATGREK